MVRRVVFVLGRGRRVAAVGLAADGARTRSSLAVRVSHRADCSPLFTAGARRAVYESSTHHAVCSTSFTQYRRREIGRELVENPPMHSSLAEIGSSRGPRSSSSSSSNNGRRSSAETKQFRIDRRGWRLPSERLSDGDGSGRDDSLTAQRAHRTDLSARAQRANQYPHRSRSTPETRTQLRPQ